MVGEPLVCRSTSSEDRADGFFNNALFRVVEVSARYSREVTVQEEGRSDTKTIQIHLEELGGENVDPLAIPLRFGYCFTPHTAQGGEWPTVYI